MTGGWAKVLTGPFARTGGGLIRGFFFAALENFEAERWKG